MPGRFGVLSSALKPLAASLSSEMKIWIAHGANLSLCKPCWTICTGSASAGRRDLTWVVYLARILKAKDVAFTPKLSRNSRLPVQFTLAAAQDWTFFAHLKRRTLAIKSLFIRGPVALDSTQIVGTMPVHELTGDSGCQTAYRLASSIGILGIRALWRERILEILSFGATKISQLTNWR